MAPSCAPNPAELSVWSLWWRDDESDGMVLIVATSSAEAATLAERWLTDTVREPPELRDSFLLYNASGVLEQFRAIGVPIIDRRGIDVGGRVADTVPPWNPQDLHRLT